MKRNIMVVGMGTIGNPLLGLFLSLKDQLGFGDIFFTKSSPKIQDIPEVESLVRRGGKFTVSEARFDDFRKAGMNPERPFEEALCLADVIIDCTPKGTGLENKKNMYCNLEESVSGFIAQGSEKGFSPIPYAYRISDNLLLGNPDEKYIWVVSCNTHAVTSIVWTIALDQGALPVTNLRKGEFTLIRRVSDISQAKSIPAIEVDKPGNTFYGSHQAQDAANLFEKAVDWRPPIFSSALKGNNQYMHVTVFSLELDELVDLREILARVDRNPLVALTHKNQPNLVFSFGRDHGHYGRLLNQVVIYVDSLSAMGNFIRGTAYTPQDGNSLLSSLAATLWKLYGEAYREMIEELIRPKEGEKRLVFKLV